MMTAAAAHREAKAREIENILTLSDHHRNLWSEIAEKPELQRIFQTNVDVLKKPATVIEEVFLNEAAAHFLTGWRISKAGGITTLKELAIDAKWFFSLPLPRAIWEKTKKNRNRRFVTFIDKSLVTIARN